MKDVILNINNHEERKNTVIVTKASDYNKTCSL